MIVSFVSKFTADTDMLLNQLNQVKAKCNYIQYEG